jgi:hypothetical protein
MDPTQSPGMVSRMGTALATPFGTSMTWTQLAAVIVFISVVAIGWRQVVLFIAREV